MDIIQAIRSYSGQPLTHQLIVSLLKGYKRPNDRIHELLEEGILLPVRKGMYIAGPLVSQRQPEPFLLANLIFGPSYVSLDSALSYYGLIPERVYEISSITVRISKKFATPMGIFSYTHLPLPYYVFGIRQVQLSEEQFVMMATSEKALCDKIVTTAGVTFRNQKDVLAYLLEDQRMDEEVLRTLDPNMIGEWIEDAPKKESLKLLIEVIKSI